MSPSSSAYPHLVHPFLPVTKVRVRHDGVLRKQRFIIFVSPRSSLLEREYSQIRVYITQAFGEVTLLLETSHHVIMLVWTPLSPRGQSVGTKNATDDCEL